MSRMLLKNCHIFDGTSPKLSELSDVLVEDGLIISVGEPVVEFDVDETVDVGGRTLMPGLIDAHYHAYGTDVDFPPP